MPTFETSSSSVRTTRIEVHFDSPLHINRDAVYGCVVTIEQSECTKHGKYTGTDAVLVGKRLTSKGKEHKKGKFGVLAGTLPWIHLLSAHILKERGFNEAAEKEIEMYRRRVKGYLEILEISGAVDESGILKRDREVLQLFFPGSTVADQTCLAQV